MCPTWGHLLGPEQQLSEPGNGLLIADKITLGSSFWSVAENSAQRARLPILLEKCSNVEYLNLPVVPWALHLSDSQKPRLKEGKRQVQSGHWSGRFLFSSFLSRLKSECSH